MTFSHYKLHSEPLFKQLSILKFTDIIKTYNCLFVHDYLNGKLPSSFDNIFKKVDNIHNVNTRSASKGLISLSNCRSSSFGLKSIYRNCIISWNTLAKEMHKTQNGQIPIDLQNISRKKLKYILKTFAIDLYKDSMPVQWFQTNWFVSQTLDVNRNIKLIIQKCKTFKCTLTSELKIKISWSST